MYTREQWAAIEARFGRPRLATARAPFDAPAFALLEACARRRRAHDVTLLIRRPGGEQLAVIRKPGYPPKVFRPPSGGVEPGETIEAGAFREALEETGLEIRLERYLLRVDACFTHAGREAAWATHVLAATAVGGRLEPRDHKEIAEARWATPAELHALYRPRMLAMGSPGMRYRVDLQDAALALSGHPAPAAPEGWGDREAPEGYSFRLLDPASRACR